MMKDTKIFPFMKFRMLALVLSAVLVLTSIGSLVVQGLNFGLDFTGGTLIELRYQETANLSQIRQQIESAGYDGVVQNFGEDTDVVIRLQESGNDKLAEKVLAVLDVENNPVSLQRIEFVGPQVGEELKEQGGMAMLLALAIVMIYVAIRFQFKFSLAAVIALAHDVLIALGFFSVFQFEFDLTVLAALLAVIGYSLNDTIVVADRIRENFRLMRKTTAEKVIDTSLTQTLSRTVITSLTTFLVLLVLLIWGGQLIQGFAIALIIGVIVGTYSSIYVAANALMMMHISQDDLLVHDKENQEYDTP